MQQQQKPRSTLTDAIHLLSQVDELEGQSHKKWDDSFSNLCYGRLNEEIRERYIQQTYEATKQHAEAMEKLREAIKLLQSFR